MELIVDIQGFTAPFIELIPKEVAIQSRDGSILQHFLFKPPYPWNQLNRKYKKQAIWLYRNHHGLKWSDGHIAYEEMYDILKKILQPASKIYVKGVKKKEFLNWYDLPAEICDVEASTSFNNCITNRSCFVHSAPYICALSNIYKIKTCLDDNEIIKYNT